MISYFVSRLNHSGRVACPDCVTLLHLSFFIYTDLPAGSVPGNYYTILTYENMVLNVHVKTLMFAALEMTD
jgi:hypothetical protein